MALVIIKWIILFFNVVIAQDDFVNLHKYAAIDNITTINFESSFNFTTIVSPSMIKSAYNPLFVQDKPWEPRIDNGYPSVIYTPNNGNKTWQLWYGDNIQMNPQISGILYAQSIDGIHWIKPNLGINKFNGSTNNNIMFMGTGAVGILKDKYTNNKDELYKAYGTLPGQKPSYEGGTATSPNGIYNWSNFRQLNINARWGDANNLFFDINKTNQYIGTNRGYKDPPRTIAITHSTNSNFNSSFTNVSVVESGGNINQTYSQITFRFYNIYLGLVMIFDTNDTNGRVFCELSYSVDMNTWYRVNEGQQVIPLSSVDSNQFDSHICFAAAFPVMFNDRIWLYYMGGNGPHYGDRNSSLGLGSLRLDGFAGIKNSKIGNIAMIESYENIMVSGKYFIINVDMIDSDNSYNQNVKIGFENINNFELNDCDSINKNVSDYIVSWNGNNDLSILLGKVVKVKFELSDSILYTFGFVSLDN